MRNDTNSSSAVLDTRPAEVGPSGSKQRPRRRLRFSVTTLLLLTTIAALLTAGWKQNGELRVMEAQLAAARKDVAVMRQDQLEFKDLAIGKALRYRRQSKYEEAIATLEATLKEHRRPLSEEDAPTVKAVFYLGEMHNLLRQRKAAETYLEEYVDSALQTPEDRWGHLASALSHLGGIRINQGRFADAEQMYRRCVSLRTDGWADHWTHFSAHTLLGHALLKQAKFAEAEPHLLKGYEGLVAREAEIPQQFGTGRIARAAERLVQLYVALDKPELAKEWRAVHERRKADVADQL